MKNLQVSFELEHFGEGEFFFLGGGNKFREIEFFDSPKFYICDNNCCFPIALGRAKKFTSLGKNLPCRHK